MAQENHQIYILRATVMNRYGEAGGNPYRTITIEETSALYTLAQIILQAFHFDSDHLFGFYDNVYNWTNSHEQYDFYWEEVPPPCPKSHRSIFDIEFKESGSVMQVRVNNVFCEIGKRMLFLYDYGDEWHFVIEFEGKRTPKKGKEYPAVIKRKGKAPKQYDSPYLYGDVEPEEHDQHQKTLDEFCSRPDIKDQSESYSNF